MSFRIVPLLVLLAFSSDASAGRFPKGMIEITDVNDAALGPVLDKVDSLVAAGEKTVMFRINSYGGNVAAGLDFIQAIEEFQKKGVKVICVVDTKAMSMGFAILQAVCNERLMTKRSVLLAHKASTQIKGNDVDVEEDLEFLRALDRSMAEVCAARLKISVEEYRAKISTKDWTMAWQEAKKIGAVDGIVAPKDLPPLYELEMASPLPFLFLPF